MMEQKIFCVNTYYKTKCFKIVQAKYRRKFNFLTFLNRSLTLKLMALVKIKRQQVAQSAGAAEYTDCFSAEG